MTQWLRMSVEENNLLDKLNIFNRLDLDSTYHYFMIAIICLGFGVRLLGLNKGIWIDEYFSVEVISAEDFYQELRLQDKPPLFYLAHKLGSMLGMSEPFLRMVSVVFGVGTLVILMQWIKRYSRLAGLLAGLVCALMPIMLRYSQEIRGYSVLLFATVCSFYFASRLTIAPKRSLEYIGLALSLTVAVATHSLGVILIPAIIAFIVTSLGTDYRKIHPGKASLAVAGPGVIFYVIFFFFLKQLPDSGSWWMPPLSFQLISSTFRIVFGVSALRGPLQILQDHLPAVATASTYLIKAVIVGVFISLVFFGNWRRSLPLFVAAAIYWLQIAIYSLIVIPIFWYRTVLPGSIPFIGFIAVQLATIQIKQVKAASIFGVALLSLLFAIDWTAHSAWVPFEEWKQLSSVLEDQWEKNDLVIFYPENVEGPLRFYFSDLPIESSVAVKIDADVEELELDNHEEISASAKRNDPYRVFLIVRFAASVENDLETYNRLLAKLEAKFGPPAFSEKFGNLSLSKYESKPSSN